LIGQVAKFNPQHAKKQKVMAVPTRILKVKLEFFPFVTLVVVLLRETIAAVVSYVAQ
jgi:hypothetical protein